MSRLPTETELLINEYVMGGCNHPGHTTETVVDRGVTLEYLVCTKCGRRFFDNVYPEPWEKDVKKPNDYLKKFVPLFSEDIIMARAVVRKLESEGWSTFIRREQGKFKCSFSKGAQKITGSYESNEHTAICAAAKEVARNAL